MGNRVPGMVPGKISGLFDPNLVESLVKAEGIPVENAKKVREKYVTERNEVQTLQKLLSELDVALNGLKSKADFYKMKVESSHPDIIDGTVTGYAMPGSYEFEVRGLAKAEKELAYGFPDKDKTPVGFGYMLIEREDMDDSFEIVVEPGATLKDVANQINDAGAGVRAMIINTKYKPDSYRLLVISEKSGNEARVYVDEDTTFLEFKEQVTGRNLDVLFEDVPVTDEDNNLEELIDGVVFNIKRSEPGTRVQVSIVYDIDKTLEAIKKFVEKYNATIEFVGKQIAIDPNTGKAGILAADSTIRAVQRGLQSAIGNALNYNGKYSTLAEVGITTDPKTGKLNLDEAKVRGCLADSYDSVASLFIRSDKTMGFAETMAERLKELRDNQFGAVKGRLREMDSKIKNQDQIIERKERDLEKREDAIRRRFINLESQLSSLKSQGDFLSSKLGGSGGAGG
ncbi:MAG: flagellar filament capping protein FliD [Oligoflexales bacterium]|nr:flagellar filament capping protein FliD [Oligoflexales bacterium]